MNWAAVTPEIVLLTMACVIALVDLFVTDEQRGPTFWLTQATLAAVAPGIAEALVATAIGLFAAIPAVIAYNRYADQVSRLELRYDTFMEEFSTLLQRHAASRSS